MLRFAQIPQPLYCTTNTLLTLLFVQPVEGIATRIAWDLKLFAILAEGRSSKKLPTLVEATKATPELLGGSICAVPSFVYR
jgi:hypothetical protein